MSWWKHAFAIDDGKFIEPTALQMEAIDRVLREVRRRRLTVPALMLLETCRPLNYVGSQLLVFFSPILKVALAIEAQDEFARFLEQRGSIDFLLDRLENLSSPEESSSLEAVQEGDASLG